MNKKSDAELLAAQVRMSAQRDAVVELMAKTGWSKTQLQVELNRLLSTAGAKNIRGESYFAKKLKGDRSGFRGAPEAQLQALCKKYKVRWPPSDSWAARLRRQRDRLAKEEMGDVFVSPSEFAEAQLYAMRQAALKRAIQASRHLPLQRASDVAHHPHESQEVIENLLLREKIFCCVESILNIPRRYREYHDIDSDPEWEFAQDPYYKRLAKIEAKSKLAKRKVAKK